MEPTVYQGRRALLLQILNPLQISLLEETEWRQNWMEQYLQIPWNKFLLLWEQG